MPNWTNNNVVIVGTKEQLDKIEKIQMDFQKIIPMPAPLYTDQMAERCVKCDSLMVKGEDKFESGVPESFNVLIKEIKALGLNIELN